MNNYKAEKLNEMRERTLVLFYFNMIKDDNKIDVYEYMKYYYYVNELTEKYRKSHSKALYMARENFEKMIDNEKVKKLEK